MPSRLRSHDVACGVASWARDTVLARLHDRAPGEPRAVGPSRHRRHAYERRVRLARRQPRDTRWFKWETPRRTSRGYVPLLHRRRRAKHLGDVATVRT